MFWSLRRVKLFVIAAFITAVFTMPATTYGFQTATPTSMQMPMPGPTPTPDNRVESPPTKPNMTGMKSSGDASEKSAPSPTPMPGMAQTPATSPDMKDMKSNDASPQAAAMGYKMMGAAGLVPHGVMVGMKGRWMVSHHFMNDRLEGNLVGTRRVTDASVLINFEAAPTDMTMHMNMFMVMYALTNKFTLMAMLPYTMMSMGELHRDGTRSTERSEGIGDVELRGNYVLYKRRDLRHRLLLNGGVGLPTGSINRRDEEGARLEYPMQPGS